MQRDIQTKFLSSKKIKTCWPKPSIVIGSLNVVKIQNILSKIVEFLKFNISNHCRSKQVYVATNEIKNRLEGQLGCLWLKPILATWQI